MSVKSQDFSIPSSASVSNRSRKSLAERIRELGFLVKSQQTPSRWSTYQLMDVKIEENRPSKVLIMIPALNLQQMTYHQPRVLEKTPSGVNLYEIQKFETKSKGPKEIKKISDIEVKSYKPTIHLKFRKKKRRSTTISRIEEILNRGKGPLPLRDPSEESVELQPHENPKRDITDLPENVLYKIFFYLSQRERSAVLSRVCKLWYYILKDPIFWKELEFEGAKLSSETIIRLIKTYPTLQKLQLTSVPNAVEVLLELCRCNHSITNLGVRRCVISHQDFIRIILHVITCCTKLEVLDIKGMQFQSERFYLELGQLKHLKGLNLTGNKLLRSKNLITLSINCRGLRDLRILDTTPDNGMGPTLKDDDLVFVLSQLERNLQTLKIDMQQLGNISYQAILACPQLKCLVLKNCLLLTSDIFRQFPVLTNLKKLAVTRGVNIKPEDFQFVFSNPNMWTIEELNISGCWNVGERGLNAITQNLDGLKSLSLKNCKSLRNVDLSCLFRCFRLKELNLAHTEIEVYQLLSLHERLKSLRTLVLDTGLTKKSGIRHLRKSYPSLTLRISFSEYQKDERLLIDF